MLTHVEQHESVYDIDGGFRAAAESNHQLSDAVKTTIITRTDYQTVSAAAAWLDLVTYEATEVSPWSQYQCL